MCPGPFYIGLDFAAYFSKIECIFLFDRGRNGLNFISGISAVGSALALGA
mgnify:CR=1 FL=1